MARIEAKVPINEGFSRSQSKIGRTADLCKMMLIFSLCKHEEGQINSTRYNFGRDGDCDFPSRVMALFPQKNSDFHLKSKELFTC